MPHASCCSSARSPAIAAHADMATAPPSTVPPLLDIGVFYWILAAFLFYTAWCNARQSRWLHAGFWSVLGLLFAAGDSILAASKASDARWAQAAGVGVIALG